MIRYIKNEASYVIIKYIKNEASWSYFIIKFIKNDASWSYVIIKYIKMRHHGCMLLIYKALESRFKAQLTPTY